MCLNIDSLHAWRDCARVELKSVCVEIIPGSQRSGGARAQAGSPETEQSPP